MQVVDVSSILPNTELVNEEICQPEIVNEVDDKSINFNLEFLESEEDVAGEWDVVATRECISSSSSASSPLPHSPN